MQTKQTSLVRFAWLSIAAAIATIGLKTTAYLLTGSVGLLSDAIESVVNLIGAVMALLMLAWAARDADEKHPSGHGKAEYFSSGLEGGLIIIAAAAIAYTAVNRLFHPQPLEQIGVGLGVSVIASIINFVVARILFRAAKQHNSIALEADSRHLMADVWTSVGILAGVGAVGLTGWVWLDSVVALAVSVHIVWAGSALVRRSIDGLMDAGLPKEDLEKIEQVMDRYRAQNILFHALRTRRAAAQRFISVHMLVPGEMTVHDAHHMAADFERDLHALLDQATITTRIEPREDKSAFH